MLTRKMYFWAIVVILAVGLLMFANISRDKGGLKENPTAIPIPDASASPINIGSTQPNPPEYLIGSTSQPTASLPAGISDLIPTCTIGGEVVFIEPKLARIKDAYFRYDLVGDSHDIMKWVMTPSENNVNIGPNRFSRLPLPKGQETIVVGFENPPQQKQYKLKASIDYPYWVNGEVKVLNRECSGETVVNIQY